MGAEMEAREGRLPPLTVRGAELTGIEYEMPVASAQVKSCVLIAGMLAAGETTVIESAPEPRPHRADPAPRARAVRARRAAITVAQVDELELDEIAVPGDPSSAAFIVAAATLVPDSRVVVRTSASTGRAAGSSASRERMGAVIVGDLEEPGTFTDEEPVGELDVASARSRAPTSSPTRCRSRSTS